MTKPILLTAIKVQFIQSIFEDDFVETGMKAWLTKIEWNEKIGCYNLYFDFTDFEEENAKYFTACYYTNRHTQGLAEETGRTMFTAVESKQYTPKYSVYFSLNNDEMRDDSKIASALFGEYLTVLESNG